MRNIGDLMKQMQGLQAKVGDAQKRIEALESEGSSGAGMVRVTLTGGGALRAITIDPSLLVADDREILEDLIKAAHEDARKKVEERRQQEEKSLMGGLGLPPGFKMPF
jgi:DNA-binding YbaB/EbfC family protein